MNVSYAGSIHLLGCLTLKQRFRIVQLIEDHVANESLFSNDSVQLILLTSKQQQQVGKWIENHMANERSQLK